MSEKMRVAGLVYRICGGKPLLSLHVPAKADLFEDYSLTTITSKLTETQCPVEAMRLALYGFYNLELDSILPIRQLNNRSYVIGGKLYKWCLVQVNGHLRAVNLDEVQEHHWCCSNQLATLAQQMSEGRQIMLRKALESASKLDHRLRPFLKIMESVLIPKAA